jgi:CheY-like chemotaxis protein
MPRPQSILLIERNDDSRVTYAEYLQTLGFTVLTADTTDEGLTNAGDANVIVTGIRVPGSFDAVELVRRVRQTDRTKHTPIIVLLSAGAFESDRQGAFAAGCDLFLPKHCPPERLASEIRAVGVATLKDVEVIMDQPNRSRTKKVVTKPTAVPDALAVTMTDRDIARCAFERYEERGRERGHDIDDWLQAERDLQDALNSIVGCYPREMPGLHLRLEQVQRLCGIGRPMCQMVLDSLVDARFLSVKSDGHYALLRDGGMSRRLARVMEAPVASANR